MPPLAVGGLRGVGLDMGLLEAPAASLPRLTSLVARSARLSAAVDTGKKDTFLPEEAALAGLPASPSGSARVRLVRRALPLSSVVRSAAAPRAARRVFDTPGLNVVFPISAREGAPSFYEEGVKPPLVGGRLRGSYLDLGCLDAPMVSLPRLAPLAARTTWWAAAMDTGNGGLALLVGVGPAGPPTSMSGCAHALLALSSPSGGACVPLCSRTSPIGGLVASGSGPPLSLYFCDGAGMPHPWGMLKPWELLIPSGSSSSGDACAGGGGVDLAAVRVVQAGEGGYPTSSYFPYGHGPLLCPFSTWWNRFQGSCYALLPVAMYSNGFCLIDYSQLRRRRHALGGGASVLGLIMALLCASTSSMLRCIFGASSALLVAGVCVAMWMGAGGGSLSVASVALLRPFFVGVVFHVMARLGGCLLSPSVVRELVPGSRGVVVAVTRCRGFLACLLFWGALGAQLHRAEAVCLSCNGNVPNCPGDATCPMAIALATNLVVMAGGAAAANKVLDMGSGGTPILPLPWLQILRPSVLDALVAVARRAPVGTPQAIRDMSVKEILDALIAGSTSHMDARLELARRVTDPATTAAEKNQIKTVCEVLPKASAEEESRASKSNKMGNAGALQYVYALAMRIVRYLADPTRVSIAGGSSETQGTSSTAATLAAIELKRPKSLNDFLHSLTIWQSVLSAVGLASAAVLGPFLSDVVHVPMADHGWEVALEHFLLYLQKIDSGCGWALATATSQGSQDTFLNKAIKAAPTPKDPPPSRQPGADPSGGKSEGAKAKFNGKSSSDPNARPCAAYNTGSEHRRLNPDGSCPFRHVCDQWVSNKGPGGKCLMAHARMACTNAAKVSDKVE